MSPNKISALQALVRHTRPLGEMCVGFATLARETGQERAVVRRAVRSLARDGLAEFHRGLVNEDSGEFAGAGYCVTYAGQDAEMNLPYRGPTDPLCPVAEAV